MPGILYIVATPIGNLSDTSERVRSTLNEVSAILCEDTRVTSKLLAVFNIRKPLLSYHQHSDDSRTQEIIRRLMEGESFALVTDAGTPGISDPGGRIIEAVVREMGDNIVIHPIPGPCAAITALSISGFPTDAFFFFGFPPQKKGRRAYFKKIAATDETVVFYESTHRIEKTLEQLGEAIGDRSVVVARELTKLHETIYRGTVKKVTELMKLSSIKGEFVIVVRAK